MKKQTTIKTRTKSKLQLVVRQSIIPLGFKLLGLEILFSMLSILLRNTFDATLFSSASLSFFQPLLISTVGVAKVILMLMAVFEWAGKKYIIRKDNITFQDGILSTNSKVINSSHIETIGLKQNLFERMLNYGTIRIYSPMLSKKYFLKNVTKPKNIINNIKEVLNESGNDDLMMMA